MEERDVFQEIAERTAGDIYIGVVGPVRTGKSTFIKRFMELMVLPNIKNVYDKQRTIDELPQSGTGRLIMTTEPKFVPNEAVEILVGENVRVKVRLVDCVGYTVEGALGYEEDDGPRMVTTPWFDNPISFQEAAEIGTHKVISDHSTIGLVVVTDGSITDIPRKNYINAEERVINELNEIRKPYLVILNSTKPGDKDVQDLAAALSEKYQVPVLPVDCARMSREDVINILQNVLYEFPVREINVEFPKWFEALETDHWLRQQFQESVLNLVNDVAKLRDIGVFVENLGSMKDIKEIIMDRMDLGTGEVTMTMKTTEGLFHQILEEVTGFPIEGDHHLLKLMKELVIAKQEYDKVAEGIREVRETGYGIVMPTMEEIIFEEPELIRQGNRFGVRLIASAPSIHMIRADIKTEITPFVGTEKQGEELVKDLNEEFESDPSRIWESEFLGRSMYDLVKEGLESKLVRMPENAQQKLQETLEKIVNEGSGGLICIIL